MNVTDRPKNAFLRNLSSDSYDQLREHLVPVDLSLSAYLQHDEERTEWVYFPEASLLSMIASNSAGELVETSMVGNEGAAGLTEACGSQHSSVDCVVQVDGRAWRAPATICRNMARSNQDFSVSAWRLAELQLLESRQSALCQAMHTVEPRFARWLLESVDRCGGRDPLPMTQQFLAAMLGVQRSTVSMFASALQRKEIIRYRRGRMDILDRPELEKLACDCRANTLKHRARLGFSTVGDQHL
jgi:CRP-like cAMP-binding protein